MQKIAIFIPKVFAMSNVVHKKAAREVLVMGALMGIPVAHYERSVCLYSAERKADRA